VIAVESDLVHPRMAYESRIDKRCALRIAQGGTLANALPTQLCRFAN
jgi:hypothetical protein